MGATHYLHGSEVLETSQSAVAPQFSSTGVVGVIGPAPSADNAVWPIDEPVLLAAQPRLAAKLGIASPLYQSIMAAYNEGAGSIVAIRCDAAQDPQAQLTKIIGDAAAKTGLYGFLGARSHVGVAPKTIIAPGYTGMRPGNAPNPVVQAALIVAGRLRGRVYADAPQGSYGDALTYRNDFNSDRLTIFYPWSLIWDALSSTYIAAPASAMMAGQTARVQSAQGFWQPSSNQPLNTCGGVSSPIDWAQGDPDCEANMLNASQITTIINTGAASGIGGGWRRWGVRTCAGADQRGQFESVRTILDAVYQALDEATLWSVDKPATPQLLLDMAYKANSFFKYGINQGFLVGGKCWLDPELNPAAQVKQGIWNWSIDPEGVTPMEHIIYTAYTNDSYYGQEVAAIASLVAART